MKKEIGYIVSIAGLVVMALSFGLFQLDWAIFKTIPQGTITAVGVIGIIVGVVISLSETGFGKKKKQAQEEVPIYEGTGKNRKIVGYQRG
ncbi:MAG: hypothetical protein KKF50_01495 [Nanoarchaeota archaeon]|nr:hypothetical protein [Nanoarchaeota archaeon]